MPRFVLAVFILWAGSSITSGANQQAWSHYTYNDEPYTLMCRSGKLDQLSSTDVVTWNRHGVDGPLTNDDHYELIQNGSMPDVQLKLKKVTDELHGIYICHIWNNRQELLDSVVQGVNVGTRPYRDDIDKYQKHLITGAITAAGTLLLIITVGLISHFRYLSDESLEKRRQRKEDRLRSKAYNGLGRKNDAYEINPGMEMTEGHNNNTSHDPDNSYVHF